MAEYRRPFTTPGEDRRPTLTFPRQLPIEGDPADVTKIVKDCGARLRETKTPKLFVNANPGAAFARRASCVLPHVAQPD